MDASNDPASGMKMWCLSKCLFVASPGSRRPCPTFTPGQDKNFAKTYGGPNCAKLDSINLFGVDISLSCYFDQYLSVPRAVASVAESAVASMGSRSLPLAALIQQNYDCGLK